MARPVIQRIASVTTLDHRRGERSRHLRLSRGRTLAACLAAAAGLFIAPSPASAIIVDPIPPDVAVSPSTDLVNGQTVTFSGFGFSYSQPLIVKQCTQDLATCGEPTVVTTADNGFFSTDKIVQRRIGTSVDCASAAGACVMAAQYDGASYATASLTFKAPK